MQYYFAVTCVVLIVALFREHRYRLRETERADLPQKYIQQLRDQVKLLEVEKFNEYLQAVCDMYDDRRGD